MPILDIHSHAFPENLATRAVTSLGEKAGIHPYHDGTIAGLRRSMCRAGIDVSVVLPVASRPANVPSINAWILQNRADNLMFFGGMHPRFERFEDEIQRLKEAGVRGVKLHPNFQEFVPDDPACLPMFRALAREDMIVLIHAGRDFSFSDAPSSPERLARLHDNIPGLRLICAHFGGWRMWDDVDRFLIGRPGLFIDTSFATGYLPDRRIVEMSRRHGIDRVVFGTDTPWRDQAEDVERFNDLPFTPQERSAILWRNSARLLGLDNPDAVLTPTSSPSRQPMKRPRNSERTGPFI